MMITTFVQLGVFTSVLNNEVADDTIYTWSMLESLVPAVTEVPACCSSHTHNTPRVFCCCTHPRRLHPHPPARHHARAGAGHACSHAVAAEEHGHVLWVVWVGGAREPDRHSYNQSLVLADDGSLLGSLSGILPLRLSWILRYVCRVFVCVCVCRVFVCVCRLCVCVVCGPWLCVNNVDAPVARCLLPPPPTLRFTQL